MSLKLATLTAALAFALLSVPADAATRRPSSHSSHSTPLPDYIAENLGP